MSGRREIPMASGFVALVSDEDYEALSRITWHVTSNGYVANRNNGLNGKKTIRMHRKVMELHGIEIPNGFEVDHINRNRLDNRFENLRLCDRSLNFANRSYKSKGFRGVKYHTGGIKHYEAGVTYKGKYHSVGFFNTPEEAAAAYNRKATELFGEFATLNHV